MLEIKLVLINIFWTIINFSLFTILLWRFRNIRKSNQSNSRQKPANKVEIGSTTLDDPQEKLKSFPDLPKTEVYAGQGYEKGMFGAVKESAKETSEKDELEYPAAETYPTQNTINIEGKDSEISDFLEQFPFSETQNRLPREAERVIQYSQKDKLSKVWNMVGASVQGTRHIKLNLPCQDYHGYRSVGDQIALAAVADGLGSASKSHEGARIAVDAALNALEEAIAQPLPNNEKRWEEVLRKVFVKARANIEKIAETKNHQLREYGTTLIVVIIHSEWIATGHIGDGAVVAMWEDGTLGTVCTPQSGEYANQTIPLTASQALEIAEFSIHFDKLQAVALFSDGIQHISISNKDYKPHAPFFSSIFKSLPRLTNAMSSSEQLAEFLASDRVCTKTDDDKTLVLISRKKQKRFE